MFPISASACTPAYDNGTLYWTTVDGFIFCLDGTTGALNWQVKQDLRHQNSPLLSNEYLYVLGNMSQVECRSRQDGSLVWKADTHTVAGSTNGTLALCGDMLIVPGDSWKVWGLNRHTGSHCWTTTLGGNFALNSPIVVCGKVYISACHGDFYSLDGATGQVEWRLHHGDHYTFVGWAEADGQLFVCQRKGTMLCLVSEAPGDPADCRCDLSGVPPVGHVPMPFPTSIPKPNPACWGPEDQAPTVTRTPTPSPTMTFTPFGAGSMTPTHTETFTSSHTPTPSGTVSQVPVWTDTPTPTDTPTFTFTFTRTLSPTQEPTLDPTCGCHPSSPVPTATWDATCGCHPSDPTLTPTPIGSPIPVHTGTPTPQGTGTPGVPTDTETPTAPTPTDTPAAPTATDTPAPPAPTATPTMAPLTATPTPTPARVCDPRPYPNPCRGKEVRCRIGGGPYDEVDLKIFSASMRRLKAAKHPCTGLREEDAVLDLTDEKDCPLANGIYYLQVETKADGRREKHIRKVVVHR
jgi:hypothetical protein